MNYTDILKAKKKKVLSGDENSMTLYEEVIGLINMHQEGAYWDFKKEWYGKEKDSDQLLDIICMANNLANRDAYIIVGVDEEDNYAVCDVKAGSKSPQHTDAYRFYQKQEVCRGFSPCY